jgi:hypothetical protein
MSNLNNILNKIGKIEAIRETNLGKHEIELSDYVEVVGAYNSLEKNYNTILKQISGAKSELKKAISLIQEQQNLTNNFNSNLLDFEKKAKDLGIDWKNAMPEFIRYQNAVEKQYAPKNFSDVINAYDNL